MHDAYKTVLVPQRHCERSKARRPRLARHQKQLAASKHRRKACRVTAEHWRRRSTHNLRHKLFVCLERSGEVSENSASPLPRIEAGKIEQCPCHAELFLVRADGVSQLHLPTFS